MIYDKKTICERFDSGYVDPHTETPRMTIMSAMGEPLNIKLLHCIVERITAPSTVGIAAVRFTLLPAGGYERTILAVRHYNATVRSKEVLTVPVDFILYKDDYLKVYTVDLSTGGQMVFYVSIVYALL